METFWKLFYLMAKSNIDLNDHINKAVVESEKQSKSGKAGRRNLFIFLSHTNCNKYYSNYS